MKTRKRARVLEKILMIAMPCAALLISYLILAPQLRLLSEHMKNDAADAVTAAPTPTAAVISTPLPQRSYGAAIQSVDEDFCEPDSMPIKLTASSAEKDLLILVQDSEGNAVSGESFELRVSSGAGEFSYSTTTEGRCYIVDMAPGTYRISLVDKPGYAKAESISCQVRDKVAYQPIPDIFQMLEVLDVSQMPAAEIKDNLPQASQQAVPEVIISPEEGQSREETVLDAMGRPVYTYTFNVGANGYLLMRDSGIESDVMPVDENNDGVADYGLRYVNPSAEDGTEGSGYYVSVDLFNEDNSPVAEYAIDAVPMTQKVTGTTAGWRSENGQTYYCDANGQYLVGLKSIDGKLYYFNNRGEKARQLGVDVSCFNGSINWNAVKAQGIDFALVRIGGRGWESGLVYEDSMAMDHIRGAKAAGLKVGVYFYSTAVDAVEAVQEASVVLEKLGSVGLEMPVYIDMEFSGSYPAGRADLLSTAQRVEIINAFCKTISNGGYAAGVYSGESLLSTAVDYNSIAQYSIWLANYTENNAMPTYAHRYDIWQFTDRGLVSGMGGNVDLNVIF